MSNSGTFNGAVFKEAKQSGKTYASVLIDGEQYLSFGNTIDTVKSAGDGDTVSFTWKPSDRGDGKILTEFRVAGGVDRKEPYKAEPATRKAPYQAGRSNDQHIQLSIFYGYAKDLVANGVIKTPVATPTSVADLVSTVANELMRKFKADSVGTPAAKQEITVLENPI